MSSSDDDIDEFEPSPDMTPAVRRPLRRKANTPSPKKFPKKKAQRDILISSSDINVSLEGEDVEENSDDSSDDEVIPQRGARKSRQGRSKKDMMETSEDASKLAAITRRKDGVENTPPSAGPKTHPSSSSAAANAGDIPEECSQPTRNEEGTTRTRKRLSIRSTDTSTTSGRRSSFSSSADVPNPTASEVQTIYETCSNLFNANRINPQNAFQLRLLDCINQMINSPNYDKNNMVLTSSTVEIGTKIYVCRVDHTHSKVLSLASDINLQQKRKKKDGDEREVDEAQGEGDGNVEDEDIDEARKRQKQKRKGMQKKRKFVEEDNSKLLTGLEEQNVKFVTRRNHLKKKFNEMTYDEFDFDYMTYFMDAGDTHPLQAEQELQNMKEKVANPVSEAIINASDMGRLVFLPFRHLKQFDPETHDVWGRSLSNPEQMRDASMSQDPQLPINPDLYYDPNNRPEVYEPEEPIHDGGGFNDTFGDMLEGDRDGEIPPISFHNMRTLDDLEEYFKRIKSAFKNSKSKFGWCGPNFVRSKPAWPAQKGLKKPKPRKEPEAFDFTNIDFSAKANKFNPNQSARTIFDDKVVESWSVKKTIIPFLGVELNGLEDDFHPLDFENEEDPNFLPPIFKLFNSRRISILDLLKANARRDRHNSGCSQKPFGDDHDDGFDNNDVELPRDMVEDFCSQPPADDEFQRDNDIDSCPADGGMAWTDQGGTQGFPTMLNDDPLSLVSIDSIRFSRKPKPIDMNVLKKAIFKTLMEKLDLETNGQAINKQETKIDLADLIYHVLKILDARTEKLLSVPIFIVALMHVVADRRLFVEYDDQTDPEVPTVICRGKDFNHYNFIPMPSGDELH